MSERLKKIIELSTKFGFLKPLESNNVENVSFGPLAFLVANNIRNEWFNNSVINTDLNTLLFESHPDRTWQEDCQPAFSQLLQTTGEQLPFGLVSVLNKAYRWLIFMNEKDSQKYFYRFQLKRRIWWRKFSTDPERFQISEDKLSENGERIQISAKFPWSTEVVETIHNHNIHLLADYGALFEAKVGRKKMVPHVIESVCYESPAVMTYLFDAFQPLSTRTMLRLHHRLAPYKAALAVDPGEDKVEELSQLATYLSLDLRKAGLQTLFSSGGRSKKNLEAQFVTNDFLGVPYTVVVTAESLTNGILGLRSRDTTLQEQVHISKLTTYMQQLLS